eukprot:5764717-Pleurochrysis_carterae.AAC.2
MEVVQLSEDDGGEGDDKRNPWVGHHHCLRGEMRDVTQVSAGLCEGRGGGHGDRRRGRGVSRHSRGRDMPRQGVCVSTCALPFNTAHGWRLREGEGFVPSQRAAVRRSDSFGWGRRGGGGEAGAFRTCDWGG